MRYLYATLLLTSTFLVPATTLKADDDHRGRIYDRRARDYHEWNEREAKAHRRYWEENRRRREYREFPRSSARDQADYWRWRHAHSDAVLWP